MSFDSPYWLQIDVNGTSLSPRIKLSYSAYSFNTSRIQEEPISSNNPSLGQVLKWDGSKWPPGTDNSGSGTTGTDGGDLSGSFPNPIVAKIQGFALPILDEFVEFTLLLLTAKL